MFYILLTLFVVIGNLILGFLIFKQNPRSATNKLFFVLTVILSFWAITNYFSLNGRNYFESLMWIRIVMAVAALMFPALYLLVLTFPRDKIPLSKQLLVLFLLTEFTISSLAITPLIFKNLIIVGESITPVPGDGIVVYGLNVLSLLLLTIVNLVKKYRISSGIVRMQLTYLFVGLISTFVLATLTNFLLVNVLKITSFVALGPIFSLILVGFISYAIAKHNLLDIRTVVARSVAYSILVLLLGVVYTGGSFFILTILLPNQSKYFNTLTSAMLALLTAYSFQPLRLFLERTTDKVFFKNRYDSKMLLAHLSRIMASSIELDELVGDVVVELKDQMKIKEIRVLLMKGKRVVWLLPHNNFGSEIDIGNLTMLIQTTTNSKSGLFFFDELEEGKTKQLFRQYEISIVLPLVVDKELVGGLLLSEKSSGDAYSPDDFHIFHVVTSELAIAIKNSLSYDEIKKFNLTLSEKIKKATLKLREANIKLKELDRLKDDFVSVASHELRTPMTAIKSYLWMALNGKGGKLNEKLKFYLDRSYDSTDRLIKLVNDMLNISRIESGRMTYDMTEVDLLELTKGVFEEVTPRSQELGIKLSLSGNTQKNQFTTLQNKKIEAIKNRLVHHTGDNNAKVKIPTVLADPDKIKEVLFNLIGNSLKFTNTRGSINVSFDVKGKFVEVSVADTGVGMEKDDLDKLFRKFGLMQGSYQTTKKASVGTGLGLYICKLIIETHGGTIVASSKGKGQGSTFRFTLPVYTKKAQHNSKKLSSNKEKIDVIHSGL